MSGELGRLGLQIYFAYSYLSKAARSCLGLLRASAYDFLPLPSRSVYVPHVTSTPGWCPTPNTSRCAPLTEVADPPQEDIYIRYGITSCNFFAERCCRSFTSLIYTRRPLHITNIFSDSNKICFPQESRDWTLRSRCCGRRRVHALFLRYSAAVKIALIIENL